MISLADFIKRLSGPDVSTRVFFLVCGEAGAPLFLFFLNQWLSALATSNTRTFDYIDVSEIGLSLLQPQLLTGAIGPSRLYCLGNASGIEAAERKKLHVFLASYTGPHTILCSVTEPVAKTVKHADTVAQIHLDQVVTPAEYAMVYRLYSREPNMDAPLPVGYDYLFKTVIKRGIKPTVDHCCLLVAYQTVLGKNSVQFAEQWLDTVMPEQPSLYTLSALFFAKQSVAFNELWMRLRGLYPPEFWSVFWLELVWQAYLFIHNPDQSSRKHTYRLPFSFVRQDWRRTDPVMLKLFYERLYRFDTQFKQGLQSESALTVLVLDFAAKV